MKPVHLKYFFQAFSSVTHLVQKEQALKKKKRNKAYRKLAQEMVLE